MKVAFATRDGKRVDQLRRTPCLVVFDVTGEGFARDRTATFGHDRALRTEDRIGAIAGCDLLFVSAIGPSAVARLASRGIRAVTAPPEKAIEDLVLELHRLLAAGALLGAVRT